MRKQIYDIIESPDESSRASRLYDILMMAAIIISMIPLCSKSEALWTILVDEITVTIFIIDYLLRWLTADYKYPRSGAVSFIRYPFGIMAIIDLLSILPSFAMMNQSLKVLRTFRLFRALKVLKALKAIKALKALKLLRYSRSIQMIKRSIEEQKASLIIVAVFAAGYVIIAAIVMFNVEPDTFNTFFEAIYWACITLTTIGYGDIPPVSTAGRVVTVLSAFVGIAIVALPSSIITAGYMDAMREEREKEKTEESGSIAEE